MSSAACDAVLESVCPRRQQEMNEMRHRVPDPEYFMVQSKHRKIQYFRIIVFIYLFLIKTKITGHQLNTETTFNVSKK